MVRVESPGCSKQLWVDMCTQRYHMFFDIHACFWWLTLECLALYAVVTEGVRDAISVQGECGVSSLSVGHESSLTALTRAPVG